MNRSWEISKISETVSGQEDTVCSSLEKILKTKYSQLSNHNLMSETVKVVESLLQHKDITAEQLFVCLKEVYLQSLQKDTSKADQEFATRFSDCMVE